MTLKLGNTVDTTLPFDSNDNRICLMSDEWLHCHRINVNELRIETD